MSPFSSPSICPCKMVVSRSYLPTASPVVARKAVSVRVWLNSLFSQGVVSMNQPTPLASVSIRRVPTLTATEGVIGGDMGFC